MPDQAPKRFGKRHHPRRITEGRGAEFPSFDNDPLLLFSPLTHRLNEDMFISTLIRLCRRSPGVVRREDIRNQMANTTGEIYADVPILHAHSRSRVMVLGKRDWCAVAIEGQQEGICDVPET